MSESLFNARRNADLGDPRYRPNYEVKLNTDSIAHCLHRKASSYVS